MPEKEAIRHLLSLAQIDDENLLQEMAVAMKPENILLFPDNLQVTFPMGALPSQEYSYFIGIEYGDLAGVIHDWAIPYPSK